MHLRSASSLSLDMKDLNVVDSSEDDVEALITSLPQAKVAGGHSIYQYHGFWSPDHTIKSIVACRRHFQAQDGDIIVASKPKTGTTWLKSLVFAITNRALHKPDSQNHPLLISNPHQLVPFLELSLYADNLCPDLAKMVNPRLFSTHVSYTLLPESIKNSPGCKIVYISRNPFDTFVSYVEFYRSWANLGENFSIDALFDRYCNGIDIYGPFYDTVLQYWNMSLERPENVLFLKYEDLKADIVSQLKRLAGFLGVAFTLDEENAGVIQEIAKMCSLETMRGLAVNKTGNFETPHLKFSNQYFFRKGEVGGWVNHFTPEMTERFHKLMKEKLDGSGLKFNIFP